MCCTVVVLLLLMDGWMLDGVDVDERKKRRNFEAKR